MRVLPPPRSLEDLVYRGRLSKTPNITAPFGRGSRETPKRGQVVVRRVPGSHTTDDLLRGPGVQPTAADESVGCGTHANGRLGHGDERGGAVEHWSPVDLANALRVQECRQAATGWDYDLRAGVEGSPRSTEKPLYGALPGRLVGEAGIQLVRRQGQELERGQPLLEPVPGDVLLEAPPKYGLIPTSENRLPIMQAARMEVSPSPSTGSSTIDRASRSPGWSCQEVCR